MGLREQLNLCYKKEERYNVVIEYMGKAGIRFRDASPDHIKNCYRIMENGSSIFVNAGSFKMNLCEEDRNKTEAIQGIKFDPNYKNKTTGEIDNVRPYSCSFSDPELLETVIEKISGVVHEVDINKALPPTAILTGEDGAISCVCPNCSVEFVKAPRCPECGQLIQYDKERWNKPKLENLDAWERASKLTGASTKDVADFVRKVIAIDGFSYHVGAVDLAIDLNVKDIKKPLQLIMLFGKGPTGAFQPKEIIDFINRNGFDGETADWYMEKMKPLLSSEQKNVPYDRLNGYYFIDYSMIVTKQDELISIFSELKTMIAKA